ncbi:MAG TPA: glycosyltransferase family 9 protein [Candidatus Hydrogenedentes bacterium]|nr:glycosyltransferase family 9 protein [Candidatus Hydrogenedentota bacterium]HPC16785.1 glycosyltransferase family 9 protein [Candidatus Hydrogenedentota bacterium]HRT18504.1 glycosyltransferase family 9 protein [Candidatus Hydrogenedentota bacterium]HRT63523.1 glycosyltransferase family 9 protein [Candidatus Hydrogenedentota bacterium]
MNTLIVHTGGLGDFLLACPAMAALADEGPIELLGRPERLALAVEGGIAAAAHDIETSGFDSLFSVSNSIIQEFLVRFDRCIVWMRDDGTLEHAIRACGLDDVRCIPGLPPGDWSAHASAYYSMALGFRNLPPFRPRVAATREYDIVIHPGSGGRNKNWPWERFKMLADALAERGREVVWCLGPAEEQGPWNAASPLLRPATPMELARHLAGAALYIGNDSGVTHLAAVVGVPVVAIFGPTDPAIWAPQGTNVHVVKGKPWPEVGAVLDRVLSRA